MLSFKELRINQENKQCFIANTELFLTKKEYDLLIFLLSNPNHIYSKEELHQKLWNTTSASDVVGVLIYRLRKKLGKYGKCILTRSGFGYSFKTI